MYKYSKMPKREKPAKTDVCEGCLSTNRTLLPIDQYLRVYQKLMEDFMNEGNFSKATKTKVPIMCWECRCILRNAQKFQKRTRQAFELLTMQSKNTHENNLIHLSTLNAITMISADIEISHNYDEEYQSDVKIEVENDITAGVKCENELELKPSADRDLVVDFIKPESDVSADEFMEDPHEENDAIDTPKPEVGDNTTPSVEVANEKLRMQIIMEKRKLSAESKYKLIKFGGPAKTSYERIKINEEERTQRLEEERSKDSYISAPYKCQSCVTAFLKKTQYARHLNKFHAESNKYACDVCNVRVSNKIKLSAHVSTHNFKYVCKHCRHESQYKSQHDRHINAAHSRALECRECGLRFQKWQDFYKHYDANHKRFVCDHCGFRATSKPRLANHMTVKHSDNTCIHCGNKYAKHHTLRRHIALRHTRASPERAYCVECDAQFDNDALYTRHLKTSVRHKPRVGYPCPECGKVYAKNIGMQNHYKYVHLQQTKYFCEKCSRYFLNGFRLRTHIASFHNKIQPPKNKICTYCGRGFRTNRILENHIRTHTGERPFACEYCTATFAQKTALVMHTRAIHKVTIPYSNATCAE